MENNENKTLEERKEEFKEAANQTIPIMGLEPVRDSDASNSADAPKKECKDCENTCDWGNKLIYREADDCKDCENTCDWGNKSIYREADNPEKS